MSLLSNLTTQNDIADEKDSVGGGNQVFDSAIYRMKVTLAYLQKSPGGALGLFLTLKGEDDRELRQALYLTGGDAKGNKNYYEKDGVKNYLPGFNMGNSLSLLTTGKEISELDTETKTVALYNFEAKAEVPTKVEVVTDLMGQEIFAAVLRQTVDKTKKNDATGQYEPTGETRDENEIDKFFCAKDGYEKLTSAEIKAKKSDPTVGPAFFDTWSEKWSGKTRDKTGKGAKGAAGAGKPAGAGSPAAGAGKPSNSLFGA